MPNNRLTGLLVVLALFLAACDSATPVPTVTAIAAQPERAATSTPLPPPPAYQEPTQAIDVFNASRLTLLGRLDVSGLQSSVFSYAFSPDGTRLAGLNGDSLIQWDLSGGKTLFSVRSQDATQVYYSADKTEIYTLDAGGGVRVYSDDGTYVTDFLAIEDYQSISAYFALDGWLAVADASGGVKVWEPLERKSLVTIDAHSQAAGQMRFSQGGTLLATADYQNEVKLWDWRNRTLLHTFNTGNPASRIAFSPDDSRLAVATSGGVMLFDTASGEHLRTLSGSGSEILSYTPAGRYLVTASSADGMRIWDAVSGQEMGHMPDVNGYPLSAGFSPDGHLMVTAERIGGAVESRGNFQRRDFTHRTQRRNTAHRQCGVE